MNRLSGYTIVELIIVIVVIGIIATFVTVNLNATIVNSQNMTRIEEQKQIVSLFKLYKSRFMTYPEVTLNADGNRNYYCIGQGYPVVGGQQRCRDVNSSTTSATVDDALNTQLKKVGGATLPTVSGELVGSSAVGPMVEFTSSSVIIYTVLEGSSASLCTDNGLTLDWTDGNKRVDCYTELLY